MRSATVAEGAPNRQRRPHVLPGVPRPATKAGTICDWLKADYDLGRGHAMALVHVIKNGPKIGDKHVGSRGSHRDESDTLWLDGQATKPH
jgi:hypothetical protein